MVDVEAEVRREAVRVEHWEVEVKVEVERGAAEPVVVATEKGSSLRQREI